MVLKMLSVVAVIVLCVGGVFGAGDGALTQDEKDHLLEAHNDERRKQGATNMYELKWDLDLEAHAQELADKCIWEHTPDGKRKWGENMAMMMFPNENYLNSYPNTGKINIVVLNGWGPVKSWVQEEAYVTEDKQNHKLNFSCATTHIGNTCGHYSQVVWHDTTMVGCATRNCPQFEQRQNVWILVCDYLVPGNKAKEDTFDTQGEPCSKCESEHPCKDKLCVAP